MLKNETISNIETKENYQTISDLGFLIFGLCLEFRISDFGFYNF